MPIISPDDTVAYSMSDIVFQFTNESTKGADASVRNVDQFLLQDFRVVCDKLAKIIIIYCVAVLDFIV